MPAADNNVPKSKPITRIFGRFCRCLDGKMAASTDSARAGRRLGVTLRFGFWSEQEAQVGESYARRLHDLVDEAVFAEKMGFDIISLSEQHLALGDRKCVV